MRQKTRGRTVYFLEARLTRDTCGRMLMKRAEVTMELEQLANADVLVTENWRIEV